MLLVAEEYVRDCRDAPRCGSSARASTSRTPRMSEWADFTVSPAAVSGRLAFERAGVAPAEIDVAEIYDAFTYMTLVTLEDLGFCAKGEGGAFVEKGRLRVAGGELPVNTDGGGLSAYHPGMRGLFLLVEAVRQLRGEAGDRPGAQVPRAAAAAAGGGLGDGRLVLLVGDGRAGKLDVSEVRSLRGRRASPRGDGRRVGW